MHQILTPVLSGRTPQAFLPWKEAADTLFSVLHSRKGRLGGNQSPHVHRVKSRILLLSTYALQ